MYLYALLTLCPWVCYVEKYVSSTTIFNSLWRLLLQARLLPAWAIFSPWMRLERLCPPVSDFSEYGKVDSLDTSKTLQLVLHLLTSLSCLIQTSSEMVTWSPIRSHKHHSRTGEPAASATEQAAAQGANKDILSFIKRIAPLLSPNDIPIVTPRKGSGEKRAKVIENTDFVLKLHLCVHSPVAFSQHFLQLPHIFWDGRGRKEGGKGQRRKEG